MCGIIGFTGKASVLPVLLDGLSRLEYRGYDSAGVGVMEGGKLTLKKTTKRIETLARECVKGIEGSLGIGHTRWATHGEATEQNAHPHRSADGKFCLVHNGIIENYAELSKELESEGIILQSDTDTEIIPNLLAKYYRGNFLSAVIKTVNRLEGSFALGIICTDFPDTLIGVRQFSPLLAGFSEEGNLIASDIGALLPYTSQTVTLEDEEIAVLTSDSAQFFDFKGNPLQKTAQTAKTDNSDSDKGGYEHYMLKEIFEQPAAAQNTVNHYMKDGRVCFEDIKLNKEKLKTLNKIYITACGSAYHAGMVGKHIFERLLGITTEVQVASEFRYGTPVADERTLVMVISQSGETADTLAALLEAKKRGSHTLAIVNVPHSSIAKVADDVLYTQAGPEIAVATTKGYTTQLVMLYMLGIWMADLLHSAPDEKLREITQSLCSAHEVLEECLLLKDKIEGLVKDRECADNMFFIGRGLDFALSLEASLKLKEISYIGSQAYPAGELKHGTISLIEKGTPVMALCCERSLGAKMISGIREVKARGAVVTVCATEGDEDFSQIADEIFYIPKIHPFLIPLAEIIPFQFYAYFVASKKGCDVDKPRNLAKSVTVE